MSPIRRCRACSCPAAQGPAFRPRSWSVHLRRCGLPVLRTYAPPAWPASPGGFADRRPPRESCLRSRDYFTTVHGQRETEDGSLPRLAGHPDPAAMRLHDAFGDGQAHARARHAETMLAGAEEFVEDEQLLLLVDATAAIGHAHHHAA